MNEIIKRLGMSTAEVAPMAYTGAAAIVMRTKGFYNAKTIHSWLYEPKIVYDYSKKPDYLNRYPTKLVFEKKPLPDWKRLICIDEASYVPMSMKQDLLDTGLKILVCGDLNQLPPVIGEPAFLNDNKIFRLTQIMRQQEGSAIVYIANLILNDKPIPPGHYGSVYVCYPEDISDSMLIHSDVVICGYNRTRDFYNCRVRELNGINPEDKMPHHGEKLICRKNNWSFSIDGINLANGLSGIVYSYPDVSCYDGNVYTIDFKPNMFECVFEDIQCNADFFRGNKDTKDQIRNSKYPIKGELFELGYAITTHLSQGSQFRDGMYISEYMSPDINKKLDYTGITRFSNTGLYVLKKRKFW
jgi:exodeoxyribonuclease-5